MKKYASIFLALTVTLGASMAAWGNTVAAEELPVGIKLHPAVAAADWNAVEEVVVELADHMYEPTTLIFKLGKPYKMRLKNIGSTSHDMVGGSFFTEKVIALRMINSKAGRIMADDINSIYLRAKNDTELWFIPLKEGEFTFFCSLPQHRESGMEGTIKIIP